MMAAVTDFISIDPSSEFSATIQRYKDTVRQLVGDQVFLSEPPHMTAYLARFSEGTDIGATAKRLADGIDAFSIEIEGWHLFDADPMTGNRTLVVNFSEQSQDKLRDIQGQIAQALKGMIDPEATRQRYALAFPGFSESQRHAIDNVGFPYFGPGWHPHFTIASIRSSDWPKVAERLLPESPSGESICSSLTHYRVIDDASHPIRTYDLR